MYSLRTVTASLLALRHYTAHAVSTWPAPTDELEDLIYLNTGYRSTGFANAVTPCAKGLSPSRVTAAEWLRTAFHDAISGNIYTGEGGLDGSIAWETDTLENEGVFAIDSVKAWANYVSDLTSLSDVIAAGTYALTRSCSNISVAVRGGRVDATEAGPVGFVPQPQNAVGIFRNQFARMGLDDKGMVQFVACGHTIGGVHGADHPEITDRAIAAFDSSVSLLDNSIAVEFVRNSTSNPLVVGKSVTNNRNSDFKVFSQADNNATIRALAADASLFASACQSIFQKMIDFVPSGVDLSDPITPYEVKPYDLQLTLLDGGLVLRFTGEIRVRDTERPVSRVQLLYTNRNGDSAQKPISTTAKGTASGFDDHFAFFEFSSDLSVDSSIASFNVLVTYSDSTQVIVDNAGSGFSVQDVVVYQAPQSCLDSSGKLTVVAALRNTQVVPTLELLVKVPQASPNPVPSISTSTAPMATESAVGPYVLYSANIELAPGTGDPFLFNVFGGGFTNTRKGLTGLPTKCKPLALPVSSSLGTSDTSAPSPSTISSPAPDPSSNSVIATTSIITMASDVTLATSSSSNALSNRSTSYSTISSTSTPSSPTSTMDVSFEGCFSDAVNPRALSDTGTSADDMTVSKCAAFCTEFQYFGLEYGTECYCGSNLDSTSTPQSLAGCNMPCGGKANEMCGGSNRISLYSYPNYTAPRNPEIAGYQYEGCYSEGTSTRALLEKSFSQDNMTVAYCASLCSGVRYFGVEYGRYVIRVSMHRCMLLTNRQRMLLRYSPAVRKRAKRSN